MKTEIIKLFESEVNSLSVEQLKDKLDITSSDDFKLLVKTLNSLEEECVVISENNKYNFPNRLGYVVGKIDIKEKGFGFVINPNKDEKDVFVLKKDVNGAFNNDLVLVKVTKSPKDKNKEGYVEKILKRSTAYIVGTLDEFNGSYYVKSDDKGHGFSILVPKENLNGAMKDHKVRCLITNYINDKKVEVNITDIIGHKNDPGIDILSCVYSYDIPTVFSDKVIEHANSIPDEVSEEDIKGRVDYRDELIVTIDGESAKDLDDAVSVKILDNGNYELGVHIADVSHYVKEGSPIDEEAYYRGTSVYLVDRVIPMIPHRLSNGICSLNPKVNRLVLSCVMEIDKNGKVVSSEINEGVIKTKERMTYTAVNKILIDKDKETMNRYDYLVESFQNMEKLAAALRKKRHSRGSINFETTESYIKVDEDGKPIDIVLRERYVAEKLIEEFMLVANETVAETISWMSLPFIYRVHEDPKQEKLQKAINIIKMLGFKIKGKFDKIHPKAIQDLIDEIEGSKEERAINTLLLRSMMKARYTHENLGHYGLASKFYTHFTSPIRRYPDTIVHRLLREYLFLKNIDKETIEEWETKLQEIGEHTSKKERDAIDCERDVNDMKKAEYMMDHIGEEFEGMVSSVTSFGMFVELPNTVEGLVHIMDLDDDYYEFHDDTLLLIGKRKKKIYRIGDEVIVKCKSASKEERQVDFTIVESLTHKRLEEEKQNKAG